MYKHILVPLDGSRLAECVLPHVAQLSYGVHMEQVTLITVFTLWPGGGLTEARASLPQEMLEKGQADSLNQAQAYLDALVGRINNLGVTLQTAVRVGADVVTVLVDYAQRHAVDLIVMANHGWSGNKRWWGNTADHILRAVCVPVMMVPTPGCAPSGTPPRDGHRVTDAVPGMIPIAIPTARPRWPSPRQPG